MLSEVLSVNRLGASRSVRTDAGPRFHQVFPGEPVAGFHVVLDGSVWVRLDPPPADGATGGWHRLDPGDAVLLPHGAGHVLAAPDPAPPAGALAATTVVEAAPTPLLLCGAHGLDAAGAHPLLVDLPDLLVVRAAEASDSLRSALDLLAVEVRSEPVGSSAARGALVDLVLVLLLRDRVERGVADRSGFGAALADPSLGPALRAIHADPARPWTVQALARVAGTSRSVFALRFHRLVGDPPQAYLTGWRLGVAARRLQAGDAPLGAVARSVGYTEPAFSRAFQRAYGVRPGRWRQRSRDAAAAASAQRTTAAPLADVPPPRVS